MGWEKRGKRLFYYHTHYFRGKKRRTYLGGFGDPVAELAATNAALDKVNRELDERAYAKEVAQLRDDPIIAGINAATAYVGRCINGDPPTSASPEPAFPGPDGD
jgi:hypothetical protein